MSNENLPATTAPGMNYFEQYGAAASMTTIVGTLLKFAKGDWLLGQEEEEVEEGRQFTVVMNELLIGWQRWEDKKPTASHLGKLGEGFKPPPREELGDDDEDLWDKDSNGNLQDPWQRTNILLLRTPGKSGADDEDLFTLPMSSKGGINAVGDLCKTYVRMARENGPGNPIVVLESSTYKHPEYGRVYKPVLKVVGWEPLDNKSEEKKALPPKEEPKKAAPAKEEAKKPAAKGKTK